MINKVTEGMSGKTAAEILYQNDLENQNAIGAKANAADVYTKDETYNRLEVDGKLVTIPGGIGGVVPDPTYVPTKGTPETPAIYFASGGTPEAPVILPGFGGVSLTSPLNVISWDGTTAIAEGVPVEVPEPDLSGVPTKEQIGIESLPVGTNVVEEIAGSSVDDSGVWGLGFLISTGEISASENWRYTKEFIPVLPGAYNAKLYFVGNPKLIGYNKNFEVVQVVSNPTSPTVYSFPVTLNSDVRYVRFSQNALETTADLKLENTSSIDIVTDEVFAKTDSVQTISEEVAGQAVDDFKDELGITEVPAGLNILSPLLGTDINDANIWVKDKFLTLTGSIGSSTTYAYSKEFIPVLPGVYDGNIRTNGNASINIYDEEFNFILGIKNPNTGTPTSYFFPINVPENGRYIRTSIIQTGSQPTATIFALTTEPQTIVTDAVFASAARAYEIANQVTEGTLANFGMQAIPEGTNLLAELAGSDTADASLWGDGFFLDTGNPFPSATYKHTVKYYEIYPGVLDLSAYFVGNAKSLIYDKDRNLIEVLSSSTTRFLGSITVPENARYIRLSHNTLQSTDLIYLKTTSKIYPSGLQTETASTVSESNDSVPIDGKAVVSFLKDIISKSRRPLPKMPIVSFISDDGRAQNNDWYIPILEEKGVLSTFAIITQYLANEDEAMAFTKNRVRELYLKGHDMAGHTHTHPHLGLIPLAEAEWEIKRCKQELLSLGINAEMFIYPFGSTSTEVDAVLRKYFKAQFMSVNSDSEVAAGTVTNKPPIRTYRIKRLTTDAQVNNVSRLQICKDAVDVALANNEWLVFSVHPQYPEYYEGNPIYLQKRQDMADLIDYIKSKDIPIMTCRDAFELYKNTFELNNYLIEPSFYELGMDGTERGDYLK